MLFGNFHSVLLFTAMNKCLLFLLLSINIFYTNERVEQLLYLNQYYEILVHDKLTNNKL